MFELEKIIHCWEAEVGRAFRVWFDSHNILVNKNALDTPDPLEPRFITRVLRSSLGSFEVVSNRKETVFEEIFWKVLYHNGSERTVLNVINKCLGDKVLQRFLHMTVEYTLLGKYTHCNAHADFIIRQKIREQVQTSVFPSKIVQEMVVHKQRPMLLLCTKEYLFDKILNDAAFIWVFRKCVPNFDEQAKSVFTCCENIRFSLYKKVHEGHQLHNILLNDGSFCFVDKAMRKFAPLYHRNNESAKLVSVIYKRAMSGETKSCVQAAQNIYEMTDEDVLNVFTADQVLTALKSLQKFKLSGDACFETIMWAKEVKLYKLPSLLSQLQLKAFQKRVEPYDATPVLTQNMSSVLLCTTCKEVKNLCKRESHGFKNVILFPLQESWKCGIFGTHLCDGKLTNVPLIQGDETFCFQFFGSSYMLSPCCGLIVSNNDLTATATGISCNFCSKQEMITKIA